MIIYGAGNIGRMADQYYSCYENVEFYVDTFKTGEFCGRRIENADVLEKLKRNEKIVVCSYAWREIAELLEQKGFTNINIFRVMTNIKNLNFHTYWVYGVTDEGSNAVLEELLRGKIKASDGEEADVVINVGNRVIGHENYVQGKKHAFFNILIEKYSDIKEADLIEGFRTKLYFSGGGAA